MRMSASFEKRSKVVWCVAIALFGLTAIAAHEVEQHQSRSEWVTINVPNPPPPMPYPDQTASTVRDPT